MTDHSPIPEKKKEVFLTFGPCLNALVNQQGLKAKRNSWPDEVYITFVNGRLQIYDTKANKLHPMIIKDGDVLGVDYILIK